MDNIVIDLGSNVNVFPNRTWEMMGNPKLVWSPVQLRLENQKNIIPFVRFEKIIIDIDGVCNIADFEVIEIVDDRNPYLTLLGLIGILKIWPFSI